MTIATKFSLCWLNFEGAVRQQQIDIGKIKRYLLSLRQLSIVQRVI